MPSVYAHYKFGCQAVNCFPEKEQRAVQRYPETFLVGLQGPSIFLYYNPLGKDGINEMAHRILNEKGSEFFSHAARTAEAFGMHEQSMAYLYGCICHFVLDRYYNEYIEKNSGSYTPLEIETAFDRYLLERQADKAMPEPFSLDDESARVVSAFYDEVTPQQAEKAMEAVVLYSKFIKSRNFLRRGILRLALIISGKYTQLRGLLTKAADRDEFDHMAAELSEVCASAAKQAGTLTGEFCDYVDGKKPLDTIYCCA